MSDFIFSLLDGLPLNWIVFFAAAIPVTELRASIPFGVAMGMDPLEAFLWGFLGNLLPIPFILLLWPVIYRLFDAIPFTRKFLHRYIDKARAKGKTIEKKGIIGLTLFVAIPLPVTGVWTGSLVSYILGLPPLKAGLALACGAFIAGSIVTIISLGVIGLGSSIGWLPVIVGLVVVIGVAYIIYKKIKKKK